MRTLSRGVGRSVAMVSILAALSGCDAPPPAGSAASAEPAQTSTTVVVSGAAPSAAASEAARVPEPSAGIAAEAPSGTPATAPAAQSGGGQVTLPEAKNGILPAGVADRVMPPGSAMKIVLLEAGAEPRSPLAYEFADDSKQKVNLSLDMTMTMGAPGMAAQAMTLPRMEMGFDFKSGKKDEKGLVPVSGTIASFGLTPTDPRHAQMIEAMKAPLAMMKGMTVSYSVDPRGQASNVKVDLPKDAPPEASKLIDQMRQSLDVMASPLPAEAVGEGAKWQIVQRVTNPADILQLSTVTLKKREGKRLELVTEIRQMAASSSINTPGLPPGTKAELTAFESGGTATMYVDLGRVAPDKGHGDMKAKMGISAGPQNVSMDMNVKMKLESK